MLEATQTAMLECEKLSSFQVRRYDFFLLVCGDTLRAQLVQAIKGVSGGIVMLVPMVLYSLCLVLQRVA